MKITKKFIITFLVFATVFITGGFLAANYGFFGGGTNAPSVPEDTMTRGLVGYWEFEEGTGQTVYNGANTGSVNNGTLGADTGVDTDDPKWAKGKNGGGSLQFDGVNDYVDCGNDESLNITDAITIEAWVKPNEQASDDYIFKKDNAGLDRLWALKFDSDLKFRFMIWNSGGTLHDVRASSAFTVNTWYHIIGTYNGTIQKIYVDGILQTDTDSWTGTIKSVSTEHVEIGSGGVGYFFNGAIDSVRIYNRALSAEEVRYHYNRGGPVASWGFDEGSGLTAYDATGNDNDGSVKSSALDFDGVNDFVNCGSDESLDITEAITIEAWVKATTISGTMIIAGNADYQDYGYDLYKIDGKIYYRTNQLGADQNTISTNTISANVWSHIVATRSGATARIYINGVEVSYNAQPSHTDPASSPLDFRIGTYGAEVTSSFNGSIDSVRIYNTALSEAEIQRHYKGDFSQDLTDNLVMLHHFEEGLGCQSGACITDDSSNSNNGTPTNFDNLSEYDNGTDGWILDADWTAGKHNAALEFGGTNGFFQTDSSIAGSSYFSHSLWFKSSDGAYAADEYLFSQGDDDPSVYVDTDGKVNAMADDAVKITSASAVADTDWHHLEITADGTNIKLYLDGVQEGGNIAYTGSSDTAGVSTAAHISRNNPFSGAIDSVKIYDYAREPDEIRLDYNAGVATHLGPSGKSCADDPASCMDYGLVGSWNMDEGTGTTAYDVSDEGNDGSLGNGDTAKMPKWTTDSPPLQGGAGGGSLQFDGVDDWVDCGNDESLNITDAITIEAWVKTDAISTDNYETILTKLGTSSNYYSLTHITNQKVKFRLYDGTNDESIVTTLDINDGIWHHLVFLRDDTHLRGYMDGVVITPVIDTVGSLDVSGISLQIGRDREIANRWWNGSIDSVRIYNRALSAEEVRYHYNRGGPVASWGFDEGSGQTAYDSAGDADGQLGSDGLSAGDENDPGWGTP